MIVTCIGDTMEEPHADINSAAALRAQYAIQTPKPSRRRHKKVSTTTTTTSTSSPTVPAPAITDVEDDDDTTPLIDTTASLDLHSKKTTRLQKRHLQKTHRAEAKAAATTTLLSLPAELLLHITSYLAPSSIFRLSRTCHACHAFITINASTIATSVITARYAILTRCFPLPFPIASVPCDIKPALLSPKRQEMMQIHRKTYYQHIPPYDPTQICTCMTCVFAWNNLALVVDLQHWQASLDARDPIPMIARGASPEWNAALLARNASLVRRAMAEPLVYAALLQAHLSSITTTILRSARWKRKVKGDTKPLPRGPRLYEMSDSEAAAGADAFLHRRGPPSYDFPYHRDNYYGVEAYVPNRKWSDETGRWHYYEGKGVQHARDLEWVRGSVRRAVVQEKEKERVEMQMEESKE